MTVELETVEIEHRGLRYRLSFNAGDRIGAEVRRRGKPYELPLLAVAQRACVAGPVLDIGANIGNHTVFFAMSGRAVVAVEPNPDALRCLRTNVEANGIGDLVTIVDAGAGRVQGRGSVLPPTDLADLGQAQFSFDDDGSVAVVAVDDLDLDPALVKVDVEGGEVEVLLGARRTLERSRPAVAIEVWTRAERDAVESMLGPLGYRRFPISLCATPTYLYFADRKQWLRAWTEPLVFKPILSRWKGKLVQRLRGRSDGASPP